jgi:hypothetical protein
MVKIKKEPKELYKEFGVYEKCHFCKTETDTWHEQSNTPCCLKCSKTKNINDFNTNKK